MIKLRPLEDRIVVKPLESDEKTTGGIYLPDTAKEKPSKGEVIAVGPGKLLKNGQRLRLPVKAGDKVLFSHYAGNEITIDRVEYKIITENEILAILG